MKEGEGERVRERKSIVQESRGRNWRENPEGVDGGGRGRSKTGPDGGKGGEVGTKWNLAIRGENGGDEGGGSSGESGGGREGRIRGGETKGMPAITGEKVMVEIEEENQGE